MLYRYTLIIKNDNCINRLRIHTCFNRILETEILLLKLMEENNAVNGNRITRVALRDKANAFISNHALIDQILKISVDKVAPGDKFRFRRSYNSAGHQVPGSRIPIFLRILWQMISVVLLKKYQT